MYLNRFQWKLVLATSTRCFAYVQYIYFTCKIPCRLKLAHMYVRMYLKLLDNALCTAEKFP